MPLHKTCNFPATAKRAALSFTVNEMPLADIRAWLAAIDAKNADDFPGRVLFQGAFTASDLEYLTGATQEQLGQLTPSELRQLYADAREVNGDFFAMRTLLYGLEKSADPAAAVTVSESSSAASQP